MQCHVTSIDVLGRIITCSRPTINTMYTPTHIHIHLMYNVHVHEHTHTHTHTKTHILSHNVIHSYIQCHVHVHSHIHSHSHTHTYTHIHTHTLTLCEHVQGVSPLLLRHECVSRRDGGVREAGQPLLLSLLPLLPTRHQTGVYIDTMLTSIFIHVHVYIYIITYTCTSCIPLLKLQFCEY